jgi:flagellar M-ring protein FliF
MASESMVGMSAGINGMSKLSVIKQVGLLVGLAVAVALGVGTVLWLQEPSFKPLAHNLAEIDLAETAEALERSQIDYQMDLKQGVILVDSRKLKQARLMMAKEGLGTTNNAGYALLDKEQSFGTSQFMEKTRYLRSIEGELATTISNMANIKSARVHLAIPKQKVFVGERQTPKASVFVNLQNPLAFDESQVSAIVYMVSSSVPEMKYQDVTLVDQSGRLLSEQSGSNSWAAASKQLSMTEKVQKSVEQKIAAILIAIVGGDNFKVSVNAKLNFTEQTQAKEDYVADPTAKHSEVISEVSGDGMSNEASGVPGALSNTPQGEGQVSTDGASNGSKQRSENIRYALDKQITYTQKSMGEIEKLSVAVVLDFLEVTEEELAKDPNANQYREEELTKIEALIKDAIGYDTDRGDSITVVQNEFVKMEVPKIKPLPDPGFMEKPWVSSAMNKLLGLVFVVMLFLLFIKPLMNKLSSGSDLEMAQMNASLDALATPPDTLGMGMAGGNKMLMPPNEDAYDQQLGSVKNIVADDPKRVAQVVRGWVNDG